jgi:hypothetical protein
MNSMASRVDLASELELKVVRLAVDISMTDETNIVMAVTFRFPVLFCDRCRKLISR